VHLPNSPRDPRLAAAVGLAALAFLGTGCGSKTAEELLQEAKSEGAVSKALDKLAGEDQGDALAEAFCSATTNYVKKDETPSETWSTYVLSRAGVPAAEFKEKADQLSTSLELAQKQGGGTSNAYVRACLARR
jgi:hypothetical protein